MSDLCAECYVCWTLLVRCEFVWLVAISDIVCNEKYVTCSVQ